MPGPHVAAAPAAPHPVVAAPHPAVAAPHPAVAAPHPAISLPAVTEAVLSQVDPSRLEVIANAASKLTEHGQHAVAAAINSMAVAPSMAATVAGAINTMPAGEASHLSNTVRDMLSPAGQAVDIDVPMVTQDTAALLKPGKLAQIENDFQKLTVHERNVLIHGLNGLNLPPSKAPLIAETLNGLNGQMDRAIGHDIDYYFNPSTFHPNSLGGSEYMGSHDLVGATFYIAQNAMIAFTIFFFLEASSVPARWRTSIVVAGIVTAIASWNYSYMKATWVGTQQSPTTYRYTDWLITVPLLVIEFYMVLRATTRCSTNVFWRLLTSSLVMLGGGWLGESGVIDRLSGFLIGMAGWLYLIFEVFSGECANLSSQSGNKVGQKCFNTLRGLLTVGWSIYPIGYFFLLLGRGHVATLGVNIIYNLADVINKGFFGLAIWAAAREDSSAKADNMATTGPMSMFNGLLGKK